MIPHMKKKLRRSFAKQRRAMTGVEIYIMLFSVAFLLVLAYAVLSLHSSYKLENVYEGIGFREAAAINTYEQADELVLYAQITARMAAQEAFLSYQDKGMITLSPVVCGKVGTYTSWRSQEECFPKEAYSDPELISELRKTFIQKWNNQIKAPNYDFIITPKNEGVHIDAKTQDTVFIPVLGIKDDSIQKASLIREPSTNSITFAADTLLAQVIADDDRGVRVSSPTKIQFVTTNMEFDEAQEYFLSNDESVHYIVSRGASPKVIQMVPESERAKLCDECDGIVIAVVNLGSLDQSGKQTSTNIQDECPSSYVEKRRECKQENIDVKNACLHDERRCWELFDEEQMNMLAKLVQDIKGRYEKGEVRMLVQDVGDVSSDIRKTIGPVFSFQKVQEVKPQATQGLGSTQESQGQAEAVASEASSFKWPAETYTITSCYGTRELDGGSDFHDGIDVGVKTGDKVFSVADGVVYSTCEEWVGTCACSVAKDSACRASCYGKCGNFGNNIIIKHSDNLYTRYSHLSEVSVSKGETVTAGKTIGKGGNTGYSFAEHLDMKVYTSASDFGPGNKDKGKNPLCFFSQEVLSQLDPRADSCKKLYDNNLDFTNPKLREECNKATEGVDFSIPQTACFLESPIAASGSQSQKVSDTQKQIQTNNLEAIIKQAAQDNDIPVALLKGLITQESGGKIDAISPTGASGIMQFTKATARQEGLVVDDTVDERLIPEKAIPAGAQYLKKQIELYKNYPEDKTYLGLQSYNSGAGLFFGVSSKNFVGILTRCKDKSDFKSCVETQVSQIEEEYNSVINPGKMDPHYAKTILKYTAEWGGTVEGITADVVCQDITTKQLGGLVFKPDFSIEAYDTLEPINKLVSWAKRFNPKNDFSHIDVPTSPSPWQISEGFCSDVQANEVLEQIQECLANKQSDCGCDIKLNGTYEVVFQSDGRIQIQVAPQGFGGFLRELAGERVVIQEVQGPVVTFVDDEKVDQLRFVFQDGVLESVAKGNFESEFDPFQIDSTGLPEVTWQEVSEKRFFKEKDIVGIRTFQKESASQIQGCLATNRLHAFCANNTGVVLSGDEGNTNPLVRFGLEFTDTQVPKQADSIRLLPTIAASTQETATSAQTTAAQQGGQTANPATNVRGALSVSFSMPRQDDVSGVVIRCSRQDPFFVGPLLEEQKESVFRMQGNIASASLTIDECAGPIIASDFASTYYVSVHTVDFGGNENFENTCKNSASFSYSQEIFSLMTSGGALTALDALIPQSCPVTANQP